MQFYNNFTVIAEFWLLSKGMLVLYASPNNMLRGPQGEFEV